MMIRTLVELLLKSMLPLDEEVEMLRNCINNLSEDELREAISRNYVDYNTFENEMCEEDI